MNDSPRHDPHPLADTLQPQAKPPRIAVFDSGVGGLTVLEAVHRALPGLHLRFLGDTARLPYGTKSAETVTRYALQAVAKLIEDHAADALVVACNTVSSCALPSLRSAFGTRVLGVIEPGAVAALHATRTGHVGVIGTERTVASGAYPNAIRALDHSVTVHSLATPLLVSLAEEGWFDHPATEATLRSYLGDWLADPAVQRIDTLVLGCTHYPVFKPLVQKVLGELLGRPVALVDSAQAIAHSLYSQFPESAQGHGQLELWATDSIERFARVGSLFFPVERAQIQLVDL